ncbi:hypothetical protein U9M48_037239 [Paspalum notatum var. saurae]|uniref:AB hydrolase-1 domain-containing protein n=1 Tax=Paspalum notatum var. saurae TaxID=547442 RepID=A0AAQ3UF77_PASNO
MNNSVLSVLNVRVFGNGPRVLVLTQTVGADQSVWRRVLPHLVVHHRVVAYDLVASGSVSPASYNRERYFTIDGYVDDLFQILDHLGVQQCVFIGQSFSSMIGMLAAVRRPQLITKLILFSASPRFENLPGEYNYGGGVFNREEVLSLRNALVTNYIDYAYRRAPPLAGPHQLPEAVQDFSHPFFNMLPSIALDAFITVFGTDLRDMLPWVRAPCVLVQSGFTCTPATSYLLEHLGGPTTVRFLRIRCHMPQVRRPERIATLLLNVLEDN